MLCSIPPVLIGGQGCLRESNKSGLVKHQDFVYISWPHGGSPYDLISSIEERLNNYPGATKKTLVFGKYHDISS